jgi:hypothetical protein
MIQRTPSLCNAAAARQPLFVFSASQHLRRTDPDIDSSKKRPPAFIDKRKQLSIS